MIRLVSLGSSIGFILTILTGQFSSGEHLNFTTIWGGGEKVYFGRPIAWRLVVEEGRVNRILNYVEYRVNYLLVNLLVYAVLAIFIVDFFEKRRKHSYSFSAQ
ncbi:MAG: hypothetical protein NWE83_07385 [Candidatus Bathyarchaeota archaeon]|nr:hypothetical protein [Candidatus Bathyarchaeota archaeon]